MTLLSDYETQVATDLLHDPSNRTYSLSSVDRYINEARRQLVRDTCCLRVLQSSFSTQGQESYTFGQVCGANISAGGTGYTGTPTVAFSGVGGSGVAATLGVSGGAVTTITFTSFGSGYTSAPTAVVSGTGSGASIQTGIINLNTFDVLGIAITSGSVKYSLMWKPWTVFSARFRGMVGFQSQPGVWTTYGDSQIFLAGIPNQTYPMELDTIILPTDLTDYTTVDPIPVVAQDPIKFYAAHLAKKNAQSFGESEGFLKDYTRSLLEVSNAYTRRIPNPYADGTQ